METTSTDADALARALASATPSAGAWDELAFERLSAAGRIDALTACERLARHSQALLVRALATLDRARRDETASEQGCTEAEVCAALRWAPNTVQARLHESSALASLFPETLGDLAEGLVGWTQARALVEATSALDRDAARAVQARVLPLMPRQSPASTRKALCRAVLAADPSGAERRHEYERARRRVELRPEPDVMATLTLYAPAEIATAMLAVINQRAAHRAPGDTRNPDQRRADALAALVLDGSGVRLSETQNPDISPAPSALVHVTVGIDTLLGSDDEPGELGGYGPITAAQARALAFTHDSTWRRLLTAPDGTLIHADPHTYKPAAPLARQVRLRDRTCTFPGCSVPAHRCDLDHIRPFKHSDPPAGGPTTAANLHAACRRHHTLKTARLWSVNHDAETGTITWIAPTTHAYATRPEPYAVAA